MKLKMKAIAIFMIFSVLPSFSMAQETEPNYEMKPQKTNCDSILAASDQLSESEAIDQIDKMVFRYTQKATTYANSGFQGAWWYSCNNQDGFLIVKADGKKRLFKAVSSNQFQQMMQSGDPYGYFKKLLKSEAHRYP
jgi:hypothetical protein